MEREEDDRQPQERTRPQGQWRHHWEAWKEKVGTDPPGKKSKRSLRLDDFVNFSFIFQTFPSEALVPQPCGPVH